MVLTIGTSAFGQNPSGCMIYPYNFGGYSGRVHQNLLAGASVPPGYAADIQQGQPVYDGGSPTYVDISCYRQPTNTTARECAVKVDFGGGHIDYFGGVFAQNLYSCPLDHWGLIMVLLSGILGFIFIKRRWLPIHLVDHEIEVAQELPQTKFVQYIPILLTESQNRYFHQKSNTKTGLGENGFTK